MATNKGDVPNLRSTVTLKSGIKGARGGKRRILFSALRKEGV
jgi:hypothetical protein